MHNKTGVFPLQSTVDNKSFNNSGLGLNAK